MFSRRTGVLLVVALVCTIAAGTVVHRRQARCAEVPHGFARRAPIAGASGTNTFVCPAMYQGAPLLDKVIAAAWVFAVLAVGRSVLVDREAWRRRRLLQQDDWKDE